MRLRLDGTLAATRAAQWHLSDGRFLRINGRERSTGLAGKGAGQGRKGLAQPVLVLPYTGAPEGAQPLQMP